MNESLGVSWRHNKLHVTERECVVGMKRSRERNDVIAAEIKKYAYILYYPKYNYYYPKYN
jgi:hypothetical protein